MCGVPKHILTYVKRLPLIHAHPKFGYCVAVLHTLYQLMLCCLIGGVRLAYSEADGPTAPRLVEVRSFKPPGFQRLTKVIVDGRQIVHLLY